MPPVLLIKQTVNELAVLKQNKDRKNVCINLINIVVKK